jgi:hypothetical protein
MSKIEPLGIYDDAAICEALGVTPATLSRARKDGSLPFSRKGQRILYLGVWIFDWLATDLQQFDNEKIGCANCRKHIATLRGIENAIPR